MPKIINGKKVDETKWKKAKEIADEEGQGNNYAYIMGIYKKMTKESYKEISNKNMDKINFIHQNYKSLKGKSLDYVTQFIKQNNLTDEGLCQHLVAMYKYANNDKGAAISTVGHVAYIYNDKVYDPIRFNKVPVDKDEWIKKYQNFEIKTPMKMEKYEEDKMDGQNTQNNKGIIVRGLLLPKDKVSRNNVLYDWNTVIANHKKLIGKPVMYNHEIEGQSVPVGHYTDTILLTEAPAEDSKWFKPWQEAGQTPGWYYEMNLDANDPISKKVLRQDLNKVSIQVMAGSQKSEQNDDGKNYTRAYIADLLEASIVPVPGFTETNMVVMEEKLNNKENVFCIEGQCNLKEYKVVDQVVIMDDDEMKEESSENPGVPKKDGTGPNCNKEESEEIDDESCNDFPRESYKERLNKLLEENRMKKNTYSEKLSKLYGKVIMKERAVYNFDKMTITSDLQYDRKDVENVLKMLDVAALGYGITITQIKSTDGKNISVHYKRKNDNYEHTENARLMKTKIVLGSQDISIKNPKSGITSWLKKNGIDVTKKNDKVDVTPEMIQLKKELLNVIRKAKYFKLKSKESELLHGYVSLKAEFTSWDTFVIDSSYYGQKLKWQYDIQGIRPNKSYENGQDFSSLNTNSNSAMKEIKEKLPLMENLFAEQKVLYRQIESILKKYGKIN